MPCRAVSPSGPRTLFDTILRFTVCASILGPTYPISTTTPPIHSKLGGQALVLDVEGTWRELTDVVNKLAANLTSQVRSIAFVTTAVARGDLSKQIDVDARGEILDLKNTVNGMVVQLRALAAEVTRVTLEVGSQGKLGGQAVVPGVEGVWQQLTDNVCFLTFFFLPNIISSVTHYVTCTCR